MMKALFPMSLTFAMIWLSAPFQGCVAANNTSCTSGSKKCEGNKVLVCKSDGSGFDSTNCASDEVCENGGCKKQQSGCTTGCKSDADCAGRFCVNCQCSDKVACNVDVDCNQKLKNAWDGQICVAGTCDYRACLNAQDADCGNETVCSDGLCKLRANRVLGQDCKLSDNCGVNFCCRSEQIYKLGAKTCRGGTGADPRKYGGAACVGLQLNLQCITDVDCDNYDGEKNAECTGNDVYKTGKKGICTRL